MKIALLGYGKMGRMIEDAALQRGHTIVVKIGSQLPLADHLIQQADVCIDFSHPSCILQHIDFVARAKKNMVVGTTGWDEHLSQVKQLIAHHSIGLLYSPNFSLGVHLFLKIVEEAAGLIDRFEEYDIAVLESHHNKKADRPSGTAHAISEVLLNKIKRKKSITHDLQGQIAPHELHVTSMRYGSVPGTHSVMFDSPADSLTLTHQARSREGFAKGAVIAAEWLQGKRGFYTLDDLINGGVHEKT